MPILVAISLFVLSAFLLSACGEDNSGQTSEQDPTAIEAIEPEASANNNIEQEVGSFIPSFEDYPVNRMNFTLTPDLDISAHKDKLYKSILVDGYKAIPNLAYKYLVIPVQCGANCQTNFIANKETGKIVDDIGSTWGVKTKVDSRLIIADDYTMPLDKPYIPNALTDNVRYYIIENDEVKLISEVPNEDYYNAKKVDQ